MRLRLPHEISASIVAGATVFLTMSPLHLPTWAIFITWAGTFLQGGPSKNNAVKMISATTAGAGFGVAAVLLNRATGTAFGKGAIGTAVALALLIFVINATLLLVGRTKVLSLIPGMFFGFASLFATYFGGFGFHVGILWAAFISAASMCALGPLAAFLGVWLTFAWRSATPVTEPPSAGESSPAAAVAEM